MLFSKNLMTVTAVCAFASFMALPAAACGLYGCGGLYGADLDSGGMAYAGAGGNITAGHGDVVAGAEDSTTARTDTSPIPYAGAVASGSSFSLMETMDSNFAAFEGGSGAGADTFSEAGRFGIRVDSDAYGDTSGVTAATGDFSFAAIEGGSKSAADSKTFDVLGGPMGGSGSAENTSWSEGFAAAADNQAAAASTNGQASSSSTVNKSITSGN